jgi:hypothetical protein
VLQYYNWSNSQKPFSCENREIKKFGKKFGIIVGISKRQGTRTKNKKVWNGCVELVKGKEQVLDGRVELSVVWLDETMG